MLRSATRVVVIAVVICAAGVSLGVVGFGLLRGQNADGAAVDPGSPAVVASPVQVNAPGATRPAIPGDVLPGLRVDAPVPNQAGLRRALAPLLSASGLGTQVSLDVVDVAGGTPLLSVAANRPLVPASTAKLLTGAAALSAVGSSTTLPTTVVQGLTPGEVVLVGGGDVLLGAGPGAPGAVVGRAGLADLAAQTATALRARGRTSIAVRVDDSLFRGPAVAPGWADGDIQSGFVAPVMALEVNAGQVPKRTARQADPALSAGQTFAGLLAKTGIKVTAPVVRAHAPASAAELGRVESAPVGDLVEYALTESDNTVAEALARLVALHTGRAPTFTDAGRAVVDQVSLLGVPTAGTKLVGGSGLADGSLVTARALTRLLVLAASPGQPELRQVISGLPVAGASGTMADRFTGSAQQGGLGVVRAKTGTLQGVNALAGLVVDADGRLLAFAVLADKTGATPAARTALDNVGVALARCGCR